MKGCGRDVKGHHNLVGPIAPKGSTAVSDSAFLPCRIEKRNKTTKEHGEPNNVYHAPILDPIPLSFSIVVTHRSGRFINGRNERKDKEGNIPDLAHRK